MTPTQTERALGEVQHLLAEHALAEWPDPRLLERFVRSRDEAAFAVLLHRHGPTVLRVCRSLLHDAHDTEDAFQATFLVLACSAAKVRDRASLGSFLHGTAYRVALKARARALRRRTAEKEAAQMRPEAVPADKHDLETMLHEELSRLPERLNRAFVLCHLEGNTHAQAAAVLGCPAGSVSRHLRRAGELLRERLTARGVAVPVGLLGAATAKAVPAALAQATLRAVGRYVTGSALVGGSSVPAVKLAKEALKTMTAFKLKGLALLVLVVGLAATGTALFARATAPAEFAAAPVTGAAQPGQPTEAAGVDRLGDALPDGAASRLGTPRLRPCGYVTALAFSGDGQALASVGTDCNLRLWQIPSGRELGGVAKQQDTMNAVAFSDAVQTLAAVSDGGFVALYDFAPARPRDQKPAALGKVRLRIKPAEGLPRFLAFLPDNLLLGGTHDGRIYLWDLDGKEVRQFGNPDVAAQHAFAVSPDGKKIAVGTGAKDVVVWDVDKGVGLATLTGHTKVSSLAFAPDGKTLAVGDETNTIRLWDVAGRKVTARLVGEKTQGQLRGVGDAITGLAFTPEGKTLVSTGDYGDGTIRVWDVDTGKERRRIRSQFGDTKSLALAPDGKTVAVSGMSCTIRLWDITTGKEVDRELGSQGAVYKVAVSPNGKEVAVAGCDGVIRFWDRASGKELRSFRAHERQIFGLAFSPDGKRLASSGSYEAAKLWDVAEGKEIASFAGSTKTVLGVNYLAYLRGGKQLALCTNAAQIQLVDAESAKVEQTIGDEIGRIAVSTDGQMLAGSRPDKSVHVWDPATGKERWSVTLADGASALEFTPDGRYLLVGYYSNSVTFLNAVTGEVARTVPVQSNYIRAVAASPDGRLFAVSGDGPKVGLYEMATGRLVQEFEGHGAGVWSVAFAPDGRSLVSGSFDGTALVWDLAGQALAKKRGGPLTETDLIASWQNLASTDAAAAYKAVLQLASDPQQAVPLLKRELAGADPADAKSVAKLLAELDDDHFDVREKASRELAKLGKAVVADLRREREKTQSFEVRRRLDALLEKLDGSSEKVDETLRSQRMVAVLELAATTEAKELLEHLSKKGPNDDWRRQAKSALDRLGSQP
jgi:RNA polymerase sigma factor (sigma-70 family)